MCVHIRSVVTGCTDCRGHTAVFRIPYVCGLMLLTKNLGPNLVPQHRYENRVDGLVLRRHDHHDVVAEGQKAWGLFTCRLAFRVEFCRQASITVALKAIHQTPKARCQLGRRSNWFFVLGAEFLLNVPVGLVLLWVFHRNNDTRRLRRERVGDS